MTAAVVPVEVTIDPLAEAVVITQGDQTGAIPIRYIHVTAHAAAQADSEHVTFDGIRWHRDALLAARSAVDALPHCPAVDGRAMCERPVADVNHTHCPIHRKA